MLRKESEKDLRGCGYLHHLTHLSWVRMICRKPSREFSSELLQAGNNQSNPSLSSFSSDRLRLVLVSNTSATPSRYEPRGPQSASLRETSVVLL